MSLIELKDYELIPAEGDDQAWAVRILTGNYVETVLQFQAISFNRVEEGVMSFNFEVVSSPDPELTVENIELQEYAGDLLQAIIRDGIESGSVIAREAE
jgi:hypothetical protein